MTKRRRLMRNLLALKMWKIPPWVGGEQSASDDERVDRVPPVARTSLQEEAHLLTHKPNNSYCESCRRAKMMEKRKLTGCYRNTSTRWGQLVTGYHITSTKDTMVGFDGNRAMPVIKEAF